MTASATSALHRLALRVFRRSPAALRRLIVRFVAPRYTVGAVCVVRHGPDVLLLRQRHDPTDWSLPGGLLKRGEDPLTGLHRELTEELGLDLSLPGHPSRTLVFPQERRIDLVYEVRVDARPALRLDGVEVQDAAWRPPQSPLENPTTAAVLQSLTTGADDATAR